MGITLERLYFDGVTVYDAELDRYAADHGRSLLDELQEQDLNYESFVGGVLLEDANRENLRGLEDFLLKLAQYVAEGSVEAAAEGDFWRWVFHDGRLFTQPGHLEYDEEAQVEIAAS